jgi:class 3 adenylate cyclase
MMPITDVEHLNAAFSRLAELQRTNVYLDEPLRDFIIRADDSALNAINVFRLARQLNKDRRDLLSWFVYATHVGLFDLSWNIRCPNCKNVSIRLVELRAVSHTEYCPTCQVNYDVGFDDQVEVVFSINPAIRELAPDVLTTLNLGHSSLEEHVHGLDVVLLPEFVALFKDQTLSTRESLAVRTLTIVFTDIVGSTQLYERLGDARAYNLVRDHFDVLFEAVSSNEGQIVKTIGDSVMAAFFRPDCALRAALVAQRDIVRFNAAQSTDTGRILIKVGIHSGPAIVVTLNDQLDYFGTMINQAARIQKQSRSEEILLSEFIYVDPGVQALLRGEQAINVTANSYELRGFGDAQTLYSVTLRN